LIVAVIVITKFCATVNGQTVAPSTVPSYHILVMTSSKVIWPFLYFALF